MTFFIASAILAVVLPVMAADNGAVSGAGAATTQPVAAGSAATTQPVMSESDSQALRQSIAAINQATTPQSAKAAYNDGLLYDRSNQDLRHAYLRKMTELGLCKEAYMPAQALYNLNPQNTLALGVIAINEGLDGRMNAALHDISSAVIMGSKEPLVMRTAGRLYSWYDVRPLATVIQDSVKDLVASARELVKDDETYKATYYAASQDPTQEPFGHVVLGTKPGVVRAAEQVVTTGTWTYPQPVPSSYTTRDAIWYKNYVFGWSGYHNMPLDYLPSAGPFGRFPQLRFPGGAFGTGGMPHMTPPSFNRGFAEAGCSYFFNF
jgi:hypothetical protein